MTGDPTVPLDEQAVQERRRERSRRFKAVVLLIAVTATLYGAVLSTIAANRSMDTSDELKAQGTIRDREQSCTSQILFSAIGALSDRAQFSSAQANANIVLQKAQFELFQTTFNKNPTPAEAQVSVRKYFNALTEYLVAANKSQSVASLTPYPVPDQYADCLRMAHDPNGPEPTIGPNPTPAPSPGGVTP